MDLLVALGLPPQSVEAPRADDGAAAAAEAEAEAAAALAPVRILALDGGGVRGIAAIAMLEEICRCCGGAEVADMFDLIAGTSTGCVCCAVGWAVTRSVRKRESRRDLAAMVPHTAKERIVRKGRSSRQGS